VSVAVAEKEGGKEKEKDTRNVRIKVQEKFLSDNQA
jgi:hypothetical protein